jgi:hypothetical protein
MGWVEMDRALYAGGKERAGVKLRYSLRLPTAYHKCKL